MLNVLELIEEVRIRPLLWDRSATVEATESIIATRDDLWQEIAVKLQITKDQARTKWKMLRDTFRKLVFKKIHIRKWRYMKEMEFLKDTLLNTPWKKTKPRATPVRVKKETLEETEYVGETVVADPLQYQESSNFSQDFTPRNEEDSNSKIFGGSLDQKEKTNKVVWMAAQDNDLQFLLSLHAHFKEVPPHRKLPLRMKIEQLILEEIYKNGTNDNE